MGSRSQRPVPARAVVARTLALVCLIFLAACGGGAATTPGASLATSVAPTTAPSPSATSTTSARATATVGTAAGATATRPGATVTRTAGAASPVATAGRNPFGLAPGSGSAVDRVALGGPITLTFWHSQPPGVRDQEINRLISGFQAQYPNITIKSEYQGNTLFNKVRAAATGGGLPDLITATEGQITEYRAADLVAPLNDYASSTRYGLGAADLADFYPAYLSATIQGGQLLGLPFAKSVLGLYYNEDKLREAGVGVPATWDEFMATCKRFTGDTKGYAIGINSSTFMAAVLSRGGTVLNDDGTAWQFNDAAGQAHLAMLRELIDSGCAYLVEKQFADQSDFGAGRAVFTIDASSGFSYYRDLVAGGGKFNWGIAALPHAAGVAPATTLSGSNLTVLRSTPERQLATWLFLKYATERDATAGWAAATGYLPVRQSALASPAMVRQLAEQPGYRIAATVLPPTARPEPAVRGTTETRKFIEDAMFIAVTDPRRTPREILDDAVRQGNAALVAR